MTKKKKACEIESIISDLYEGTLDEVAWRRALVRTAKAVGGQGPYLLSLVPSTGTVLRDELPEYDPNVVRRFRDVWATKDIRVPAGLSVRLLHPVTEAMILPKGIWERSEIFNEFLYQHDMAWFLASWIHKSPSQFTALSVQATHDRGPFGAKDVKVMARLVPHVRRALDIKDQLQIRHLQASALRQAFDRTSFGVVLLDTLGNVIELTPIAQSILQSANMLLRTPGSRFAISGPGARKLYELIHSNMRNGAQKDGLVHAPRGDGRGTITLLVAPLQTQTHTWFGNSPKWAVFVFDPERQTQLPIDTLRDDLHLTRREAQVVASLACGRSLTETAIQLRVSLGTVRSHLKSVFNKTGCHSQAAVVRRAAASPGTRLLKPTWAT